MIQKPEFFAVILGGTFIGPVVGVRVALLLGHLGTDVEISISKWAIPNFLGGDL